MERTTVQAVSFGVAMLVLACGTATERTPGGTAKPGGPGPAASTGTGEFATTPEGPPASPGEASCAAAVTTAQRAEVDIVVVIDTSGSMSEETAQVQQNINDFAQKIGNSGLDYRVVLIAEEFRASPFPPFIPEEGICVPPPLGGANCGDNAPKFRHLKQDVGSTDALDLILSTYDQSWNQWVRPTSYKVFIVITDDNSQRDWQSFDQALLAKAPANMFGDASYRRYIFNSICGWQDSTPPLSSQKCNSAENTGAEYQQLSQLTKGTIDSVCKQNYGNVFNKIAGGLVQVLGCDFAVPASPDGSPTDPTKVVVKYTNGGGQTSTLVQVTDVSKCSGNDGWYYNDNANPQRIIFCPTLCNAAGKDVSGKLEIAVGCKAPPPR